MDDVRLFAWVIGFWLLLTIFADIFRRRDASGGVQLLWTIFVIVLLVAPERRQVLRVAAGARSTPRSVDSVARLSSGKAAPRSGTVS
jgi:uncharacterized RDD family membrane protein YckC